MHQTGPQISISHYNSLWICVHRFSSNIGISLKGNECVCLSERGQEGEGFFIGTYCSLHKVDQSKYENESDRTLIIRTYGYFCLFKNVFCKWSLWKRLTWYQGSNQNKVSFAQTQEELKLKHSLNTYCVAIP